MSQTPLADEQARISRDEFERYLKEFRPTEERVISSLDKSSVATATSSAQADAVRARASLERMRERYGAGTTPAQAAGEARQNALSGALGAMTAGNTATQFDEDNRRQTLAGLMNVGQGIRQQAMGNFSSASALEGQRASNDSANRNAYTQQKAANNAAMYQNGAALAGTIAIVAV